MSDAKTEFEQMQIQLDQLKQARERREQAKADQEKMLADFQATKEWQGLSIERAFANTEVENLEGCIKSDALAMYEASMELPESVKVKWFTTVNIPDEFKALEWSVNHFTPALKLDTKIFEKAVKDGNIPAELATVTKEARAQIATKL